MDIDKTKRPRVFRITPYGLGTTTEAQRTPLVLYYYDVGQAEFYRESSPLKFMELSDVYSENMALYFRQLRHEKRKITEITDGMEAEVTSWP